MCVGCAGGPSGASCVSGRAHLLRCSRSRRRCDATALSPQRTLAPCCRSCVLSVLRERRVLRRARRHPGRCVCVRVLRGRAVRIACSSAWMGISARRRRHRRLLYSGVTLRVHPSSPSAARGREYARRACSHLLRPVGHEYHHGTWLQAGGIGVYIGLASVERASERRGA